ncbi:antA/AntB antirepressor family protein, partial [Faecalibaculum rodentium]
MNELQIFNSDLIPVYTTSTGEQVVIGRELHEKLEIKTPYKDWFPRMCEYGFEDGKDFSAFLSESSGGRKARQHILKFDMAKHICMIQRTEKGKAIRQKLIELEKQVNHRDSYMIADPIERARAWIREQQERDSLKIENSQLTVANETLRPKAEYFDDLVDRNMLSSIRDTAKELRVKERRFVKFLLDHGYLYRDKKGKLTPKSGKGDGLFEVKEA